MNKWLGCLLIIIVFASFSQSAFAQDSFNNDFFKPIEVKPKTIPTPPSTPITVPTPVPAPAPTPPVNPQSVEPSPDPQVAEGLITSNQLTSYECAYWWQIALCFAVLMIIFMVVTKIWPKYFKHFNGLSLLLIPIISGILTWKLHQYIHYDLKKYDNAFLCFNYWFVMGFEVIYFCLIFLLVYGFVGIKMPKSKSKKNKQKIKKKSPPKH